MYPQNTTRPTDEQHRVVDLFSPGFDFERPLTSSASAPSDLAPERALPGSFVFTNPLFGAAPDKQTKAAR
jgi:hypothetical protein